MVSAAGSEIERSLEAAGSTDLLARWMAYRLAEVRQEVEETSDAGARKAALAEQDALVMSLWAQRANLPNPVGVDRRVGSASRLLESLLAEPDPWNRPQKPYKDPEIVLDALTCSWKQLIGACSVLLYKRAAAEWGPEDPNLPLSKPEKELRTRWEEFSIRVIRSLEPASSTRRWPSEPPPTDAEELALLRDGIDVGITEMEQQLQALRKLLLQAD